MGLFTRKSFQVPREEEWDAIAKDIAHNLFELRIEIINVCVKALKLMQKLEDKGLRDQRRNYIKVRARTLVWVRENEEELTSNIDLVSQVPGENGDLAIMGTQIALTSAAIQNERYIGRKNFNQFLELIFAHRCGISTPKVIKYMEWYNSTTSTHEFAERLLLEIISDLTNKSAPLFEANFVEKYIQPTLLLIPHHVAMCFGDKKLAAELYADTFRMKREMIDADIAGIEQFI